MFLYLYLLAENFNRLGDTNHVHEFHELIVVVVIVPERYRSAWNKHRTGVYWQ